MFSSAPLHPHDKSWRKDSKAQKAESVKQGAALQVRDNQDEDTATRSKSWVAVEGFYRALVLQDLRLG